MMPNPQMPAMDAVAGGQQQPQQGQPNPQREQNNVKIVEVVSKIKQTLQDTGFFDLPENKDRGAEVNKLIIDLANAIVKNDVQAMQANEIYQYISGLGGTKARQPDVRQGMPTMDSIGGQM